MIAYSLQRQGITLVGESTAGTLLGDRGILLDDGSLLDLAVSHVRVEGNRLEGRSVAPDRLVPFDLPCTAGRDPQLEAVLEEFVGET
ncbi:MAG: hypothetical protein AAGA73_00760 [Pseudomonadota bacterium]